MLVLAAAIAMGLFLSLTPASVQRDPASLQSPSTSAVNLWIGSSGSRFSPGNTSPAAASPFGMVRLGPDTSMSSSSTSGYSSDDSSIIGFSHTRLSGTGALEGGLLRVIPVLSSSDFDDVRFSKLSFKHGNEKAQPGFYSVQLHSNQIQAELAASQHCGVHRYRKLDPNVDLRLLVNVTSTLKSKGKGADSHVTINSGAHSFEGDTTLMSTFSSRYGGLKAYYYGESNAASAKIAEGRDWSSKTQGSGQDLNVGLIPSVSETEISLKVCLSYVSLDNAKANFAAEVSSKDFEQIKTQALNDWSAMLDRIQIDTTDADARTVFYSSLYFSMLMPTNFTDVNGDYFGFDHQTHHADGFTYRTDMSLWDTFRTTMPLYSLIAPEIHRDSALSLMEMGQENGVLPRWPSGAGDSGSMFGSPANFVLTEAVLKQTAVLDSRKAIDLMIKGAGEIPNKPSREKACGQLGYCPDSVKQSVSKTLEYAWADFAIAQLASKAGDTATADQYNKRSENFRLLWNPSTHFFEPKNAAGKFQSCSVDTLPYLDIWGSADAFAEGSGWQWRFSAPEHIDELIQMYGGNEAFVSALNDLMTPALSKSRAALNPGTRYWHGNEPDLHVIYLYNAAGHPELAQKWSRWALTNRYANTNDGLDGNDDGGALTSWYVLSSLGLYPQPGTDRYWIGSPTVTHAKLDLGGGKSLEIQTHNQAADAVYVQSVTLNGKPLCHPWITQSELTNSVLEFSLGRTPASAGGYKCDP